MVENTDIDFIELFPKLETATEFKGNIPNTHISNVADLYKIPISPFHPFAEYRQIPLWSNETLNDKSTFI